MDDNMNYNQVNDDQTSDNSQPIYQQQPSEVYFESVPVDSCTQDSAASQVNIEPPKSNGFAIAGMVCGIVAAVLVCCFFPLAVLCAIAGIVLSIIALRKKQSTGMAIAGIITSAVSILLGIVILVVVGIATFSIAQEVEDEMYNEYFYNDMYKYYDNIYDHDFDYQYNDIYDYNYDQYF